MRAIRDLSGQELHWSSISPWQRRFALHAAGELVARLRWEKTFGSLAVAEAASATWTFKRYGFLRPAVSVRAAGSDEDAATLEMGWWGQGVFRAPDGREYRWNKASFWRASWSWEDTLGRPLVLFEPELLKRGAMVRLIEPVRSSLHDVPLLVCLGWYLMVLMADDAGAVTAAAVS